MALRGRENDCDEGSQYQGKKSDDDGQRDDGGQPALEGIAESRKRADGLGQHAAAVNTIEILQRCRFPALGAVSVFVHNAWGLSATDFPLRVGDQLHPVFTSFYHTRRILSPHARTLFVRSRFHEGFLLQNIRQSIEWKCFPRGESMVCHLPMKAGMPYQTRHKSIWQELCSVLPLQHGSYREPCFLHVLQSIS